MKETVSFEIAKVDPSLTKVDHYWSTVWKSYYTFYLVHSGVPMHV